MHFHAEYVDADGVLTSCVHNIPSRPNETPARVYKDCARLFAHLGQKKGWKNLKLWHANFPLSERMKRINHVRNVNGQPPRFSAEQIANADKPAAQIEIAQFDKDGNPIPSLTVPPLGLTQVSDISDGSPVSTDISAVADMGVSHGDDPSAPLQPQTIGAAAIAPDPHAAKPEPITAR